MTAFEETVLTAARALASIGRESPDPELEQRYAVVMVQARASECRHLAGALLMNTMNPTFPLSSPGMQPLVAMFSRDLTERSHKLEALGLEWAKTWPPEENQEVAKVVSIK